MKMKLKYNIGFFILIICLMLSGCRVIPYSRNDVKNFVASEVPEPCTLVNERTYNVTDKSYTFRSELRDLEFDVDCNISDNNGYHMISHYGAAVYLYYYEDLKEVYEKCSCRNGNPFEFEIQNEEDLREVSKTIAELNTVISDQWNYTPGLELTDPDILAIRVTVDVMKDGSANIIQGDSLTDFKGNYEQGNLKGKPFPADVSSFMLKIFAVRTSCRTNHRAFPLPRTRFICKP